MSSLLDTSQQAAEVQTRIWRQLGPAGRLELALDLSEGVRNVAMDGIRSRHPEYSEDEVRHALYRLMLGDELYRQAWPDHVLVSP